MNDLLFVGGSIRTLDDERPLAGALAVRGARILAVGDESAVRARVGPGAEVIDLRGGCVVPGLHDSHVHLTQHGLSLSQIRLDDAADRAEALARVAAAAAIAPAGSWLLGAGFALERWGLDDLRSEDLDRVAPAHPVLLRSQDLHGGWANRLAFEIAGVGPGTADPVGGSLRRHPDGRPSGLLLERAVELVRAAVPGPDADTLDAAVRRAGDDLAARGVTSVHHMAYEPPDHWRALALAASRERFPLRVWACIPHRDLEHARALGLAGGQGGDDFVIGGAKFFTDGALGSRTAWMLEPYLDRGGTGMAVDDPEVLAARVPLAIESGFTPVLHAIGDAANRAALDALEAARPLWWARGMRPRIEHAQHLHPDDLARFGRLGVIASVQPIHLTFDIPSIRSGLGDRAERAFALRGLAAAGAVLAFGSDTPVAPPDPLAGMRAACERRDDHGDVLEPNQALGIEQALAAYTVGAAYAVQREHRSGRLRPGYDADLALFDHDPVASLDDLELRATLKGGVFSFRAAGFQDGDR